MKQAELCAALERALAESRARYEAAKDDVYFSYVYVSEADTLANLLRKTTGGLSADELAAQTREMIPLVRQAMEEEDAHPTFDWDNEHYRYLLLEGQYDALRTVQKLLADGGTAAGLSAGQEQADGGKNT